MLHDRLLVEPDAELGERTSAAGIVIPATAEVGKRLAWGSVVAAGPHVRQVQLGDTVLFDPEERAEVELEATTYMLLRERDVHAISEQGAAESTGLYL
ncbi:MULTISPECIES: GroES family chaperonin [Brevibacterium]|uniref:Co-chaperone GroES n=2 Tax=Brevibacterium TaxID=1696 RepID=A0A6G8KST5_9MICO|nr:MULTISPECIES: co-chaperone GroES [Brevibacterium]MBD8019346.1 co-chaperone GroES [Brevibacterium gallinarum]NUL59022.1 co-chaperone GroES [Brevibacterium luteolum]QIN27874.1 co-chaperone GroES [Brevibacterium luteolum]